MNYRTRSEIALDELTALTRPLTDEESEQLRKAMHAVYCRDRRLAQHRKEERALLKRVQSEAKQKEWYPHG